MSRIIHPVLLLLLTVILFSCGGKKGDHTVTPADITEYAELLRLTDADGYSVAEVVNPWDTTKRLGRYVMVEASAQLPDSLPEGTLLRTPISRIIVYTSVHAGALDELGAIQSVGGVADAQYFKIPYIKEGLASGKVADVGGSSEPSAEKIMAARPMAVMASVYEGADLAVLERLGIPFLKMADNMERTPLGRAEWIRFIGRLVGKGAEADSIFRNVEHEYTSLSQRVKGVTKRPTVLTENIYQGVWYLPGGASYQARIIADAGGHYLWEDDKSAGSLNLSFEQVAAKASDADVWMLKVYGTELTRETLLGMDRRYGYFKAVDRGGVWWSDTSVSQLYEEFPFHPEMLLKDYIGIFHPDLLKDGEAMRYFRQMKVTPSK